MSSSGWGSFATTVIALVVLGTVVTNKQAVTQILVKNGLPKGLLPATVKSYTLAANGKFQVNLRSTCTTKIGSEELYYKKTITGDLSYRKISNLSGIQFHELLWISVSSIEMDWILPKTIWFKVGYFSKSLSADLFKVAPVCKFFGTEEEEEKEEQAHADAMSFSAWLQKALNGTLEVNAPNSLDFGAARRLLQ